MRKMLLIGALSTLALLAGPALAEPVTLSDGQLDNVTAGYNDDDGAGTRGVAGGYSSQSNTSARGGNVEPLDLGKAARDALGRQGQDISYDPYSKNGGRWD